MRKANWMTTALLAAVSSFALAGAAHAQTCAENTFGAKTGQVYLDAENELLGNKNPQAALAKLNQLRSMPELNCYERGAMLRLSAAIKIETGNRAGAIADLEEAIRVGAITGADVQQTYYNMGQLMLQDNNIPRAKEYMLRWINSGARPTRDQNWQMAIIFQKLDDYRGALPYAERVLQMDGANASDQVIDFLIFLYDRTGNKVKKAQLLERKLAKNPRDKRTWEAIAGEFFQGGDERKAFEVQKAMYHAGLLTTEDELKRIVNFYNRFNAPFEAAKVLEKEINAGRISKTLENMELLANLYQVSREYDKAIPVIRQATQLARDGKMDERLGRSYFELQQYQNAIDALTAALNKGGLKEPGYAWVLIGQSRYELENRAEAREAFRKATDFRDGRRAGNGWLNFMRAEEETAKAFTRFEQQVKVEGLINEQKSCERLKVLGENLPDGCTTIETRLEEEQEKLKALMENA